MLSKRAVSAGGRRWVAVVLAVVVALAGGGPLLSPVPVAQAVPSGGRIPWRGGSWFLQGANLPWFNWACDFGCGNGVSNPTTNAALDARFGQARAAGLSTIRWWVFEGGANQITRSSSGAPQALNPAVYADFDAALALAAKYDLYLDFVLFSGASSGALPSAWLTDATQRQLLVAALNPLFARYAGNPHLLSWELFNEPDFDVWNNRIDLASFRASVGALTSAVHTSAPGTYATVGMGFADGLSMVTGLGLDYYQAHWYDYMSGGTYCVRCNSYAFYQTKFNLDGPLVVGEVFVGPSVDSLQRLQDFYVKGYAGAWAWSLFPDHTSDRLAIDTGASATFGLLHSDLGPRAPATIAPTSTPAPLPTSTPTPAATPTAVPTSEPMMDDVPADIRTESPEEPPAEVLEEIPAD